MKLQENMRRFGTKNLQEQQEQASADFLTVMGQYKTIFETAKREVAAIRAEFDPDNMLRDNAMAVLEAYTKYIDTTIKSYNMYKDSYSVQDIIDNDLDLIKRYVDDNIIY